MKTLTNINLEGNIYSKVFMLHNIYNLRAKANAIKYLLTMNETPLLSRNDRKSYSNQPVNNNFNNNLKFEISKRYRSIMVTR